MSSVHSQFMAPSKRRRGSNHYRFCTTSQLPSDPNAASNWVPELGSLRNMASDEQRVVDQPTEEVQVTREAYEEVKHSHEVQNPVLRSMQSELHAAKDLGESWERTAASLGPGDQHLRGLLHPLLRCPDEILRLFFEEVIRGETFSTFPAATTLSHICQHWRAIAISSPRLWSCLGLQFSYPDEAVDFRVQTFLTRVKDVPTTLDFEGEDATALDRQPIKMRVMIEVLKASRVSDLGIFIYDPFKYASVLEALSLSPFPRHRITDLTMGLFSHQRDLQGSWNEFLSRFESIRSLHLDGGAFALGPMQNIQSTFAHICDLMLYHVCQLPLLALLRMTPNLQRLKLKDCVVTHHPEDDMNCISLPDILSLHSRGVAIPWETMDCPLIASIILNDIPASDSTGLWIFLPSFRMLTEIRLNPSQSQLSKLARFAPQIQDLHIEVNRGNGSVVSVLVQRRRFGLDGPAFANLRRLYLILQNPENTTLTEPLNSLIQARCPSEAHSGAKMKGVIALGALAIITRPGPDAWNPSPHFTNQFPQPAKFNIDGDLVYRFAGSDGQ